MIFLEEFIKHESLYKPKTFFSRSQSIGNIYLWGPVGRGKTMLLQAIQDCYFSNSVQFHTKAFSQWVLFPNPTTSTLRVNIPLNKQQHMSVLLYNQKGRVVQTFDHIHPPVWTYDTSTLKNGNYVVQFEKDGLVLASLKFIVL